MNLLEMSISAAILIVAITIIRTLLINKLPKKVFIALWYIVLLRLLIPFSIESIFSIYALIPENISSSNTAEIFSKSVNNIVKFSGLSVRNNLSINFSEQIKDDIITLSPIFIIWLLGFILCFGFFLITYLGYIKEFSTALPVNNEFINKWKNEHQLKRKLSILQLDRISAPLSYGIIKPVILLPKKTDFNDTKALKYVLTHEYIHIKRFDIITKALLIISLCIHWFNPFVWIMYVLFNRDIELSCDETVIRLFGDNSKADYANTLIAMGTQKNNTMPLCNNFSKNAIEERIIAIMKTKKISLIAALFSILLIIGIAAMFTTSAKENINKKSVKKENTELTDNFKLELKNGFLEKIEPLKRKRKNMITLFSENKAVMYYIKENRYTEISNYKNTKSTYFLIRNTKSGKVKIFLSDGKSDGKIITLLNKKDTKVLDKSAKSALNAIKALIKYSDGKAYKEIYEKINDKYRFGIKYKEGGESGKIYYLEDEGNFLIFPNKKSSSEFLTLPDDINISTQKLPKEYLDKLDEMLNLDNTDKLTEKDLESKFLLTEY